MSQLPERHQEPRAAKTEANEIARPRVVPGAPGYFIVAKRHAILIKQRYTDINCLHTIQYHSSAPLLTETDSRDYVDKVLEVLRRDAGIEWPDILGIAFIMDDADTHYARAWIKRRVTDEGIPICRMVNWRNALAQDAMYLAIYGGEMNEKCALVAFYGPVQYIFWMQYTAQKWAIRQVVPYSMHCVKEEVELLARRLQQWEVTHVVVYSNGDPYGHPMETIEKVKTYLEETELFTRVISCENTQLPGTDSDGLIGGLHHARLARSSAESKVTNTIPTMLTSHVQDQCYWNLRVNIDNQVYVYPRMYHRMYPYYFTKTIKEEDVKHARRIWVEYFDVLGDKTWKPYAIYPFKFKAMPKLTFTMDVDKDGIVLIYPEIDSHDVKQYKEGMYTTAAFPDHVAPNPNTRSESPEDDEEPRYMLNRTPPVLRSQQAQVGNGDNTSDEDAQNKLNLAPLNPAVGNDNESLLSSDSETRYTLNPAAPKPQNEPVPKHDEYVWADDGARYVLNPAPPTLNHPAPPTDNNKTAPEDVSSSDGEARYMLNPTPPAQPQNEQPAPPLGDGAPDDNACNMLNPIPPAPPIAEGANPNDDGIEVVPVKGSEGYDHKAVRQPSWLPVDRAAYIRRQREIIGTAAQLARDARRRLARRRRRAPADAPVAAPAAAPVAALTADQVAAPAAAPTTPKVVNREIKQEVPDEAEQSNTAKSTKPTQTTVPSKTTASKQQIPPQQPMPTKPSKMATEVGAAPAQKPSLPKPVTKPAPTTTIPAIPLPQPVIPALGTASRDSNIVRRDVAPVRRRDIAVEAQARHTPSEAEQRREAERKLKIQKRREQHVRELQRRELEAGRVVLVNQEQAVERLRANPFPDPTMLEKRHAKPSRKPETNKSATSKDSSKAPSKSETPNKTDPKKSATSKQQPQKPELPKKSETPNQSPKKAETPKKVESNKIQTSKPSSHKSGSMKPETPNQPPMKVPPKPETSKKVEFKKPVPPKSSKKVVPAELQKQPTPKKLETRKRPATESDTPQKTEPKLAKTSTLFPSKAEPVKPFNSQQSSKKLASEKPQTLKQSPQKVEPKKANTSTLLLNKAEPKKLELPKQWPKKPESAKPHTSKPSPQNTQPKKPEPPAAPVKLQKQPKPEESTPKKADTRKRPVVGQQPEEPKKLPVFARLSPRKPQTPIKQPQMPPTPRPAEPSPKKPVEEPIDEEPPAKRPIRHPKQSKPSQKAESPKPVASAKPTEAAESPTTSTTVQSRPEPPKPAAEVPEPMKPVEAVEPAQPTETAKPSSKSTKTELESPKPVVKAPKTEIKSPRSAESESAGTNSTSSDEPPAKRLRQRNPAPPKPAPKSTPAKKVAPKPKPKPQPVQKGRVVKKEAPPTRATRSNTRKEPKGETISPPVLRTRKR
uniref:Tudor domain-containing protein n=1 Tax=Panagrellus redivivus TaxID=6233 RepID=A0A7E4ZUM6_PANRE